VLLLLLLLLLHEWPASQRHTSQVVVGGVYVASCWAIRKVLSLAINDDMIRVCPPARRFELCPISPLHLLYSAGPVALSWLHMPLC
jgi:hypothetical protein